jgi:hypothetical protein
MNRSSLSLKTCFRLFKQTRPPLYAFNNPEVLERIPPEAEVVILPIDGPELCEYNRKMADKMFSRGKKIVLVKMKKPELPAPELELIMTGSRRPCVI